MKVLRSGLRLATTPLGLKTIGVPLGQRHHHRKPFVNRAAHVKIRSGWRITLAQPAANAVLNHPRAAPIPIAPAAAPEHLIPRFRALALLRREPAR